MYWCSIVLRVNILTTVLGVHVLVYNCIGSLCYHFTGNLGTSVPFIILGVQVPVYQHALVLEAQVSIYHCTRSPYVIVLYISSIQQHAYIKL